MVFFVATVSNIDKVAMTSSGRDGVASQARVRDARVVAELSYEPLQGFTPRSM